MAKKSKDKIAREQFGVSFNQTNFIQAAMVNTEYARPGSVFKNIQEEAQVMLTARKDEHFIFKK